MPSLASRVRPPQHVLAAAAAWLPTLGDPHWLAKNLPTHVDVKCSSGPHRAFMYSEGAPPHMLADNPNAPAALADKLCRLSPSEMFARMDMQQQQQPAGGVGADEAEFPRWYYFTARCRELGTEVEAAAEGWKSLVGDPALSAAVGSPEHPSLWVGGAGTTTTAHYDVMDNAFVQLHGRKRFRLWGPEAARALRVFPDLHPRARKSQRAQEDIAAKGPAPDFEVVLEAGDALCVPAFTFHEVEALELSVSLNVFSVCRAQLHGSRVLSTPVPVVDGGSAAANGIGGGRLGVGDLAHALLPRCGVPDPRRFLVDHVLEPRYRTLLGAPPTSPPFSESPSSHRAQTSAVDEGRLFAVVDMVEQMRDDLFQEGYSDASVDGVLHIILTHLLESWGLQLADGNPEVVWGMLEDAVA